MFRNIIRLVCDCSTGGDASMEYGETSSEMDWENQDLRSGFRKMPSLDQLELINGKYTTPGDRLK
jgi:hypothetical protein